MSKLTKDIFVERSIKVHGELYDYSLVDYKNNREKVKIICHKHGVFEQVPDTHMRGIGCSKCGKDRLAAKMTKTSKDFINEALTVHGDTYDYSLVDYKNCKEKVMIVCKTHGQFKQTPSGHLSGKGCSKCARDKVKGKAKISVEDFIVKSQSVHGDSYDYSEVSFKITTDKVKIFCKIHQEYFYQTASAHYRGLGCPKCGIIKAITPRIGNTDKFKKDATVIHEGKYDYSKVDYVRSNKKVIIICPDHGEFKQVPNSHLSGNGCPSCAFSGFNSQIEGYFYLVKWFGFGEEFLKVGVTNQIVDVRVKRQYSKASLDYEILYCFKFNKGCDCLSLENEVLKTQEFNVCPKQWLPDGYTETTHVENLPKILDYIKTHYGLNPEDYKYKE